MGVPYFRLHSYTAVRPGSDGLVFGIEHGVEAAVEREYAGILKTRTNLPPFAFRRTSVPR